MVSPAKPNANGLAPAKTPKEPKAPKQEALIPPDLARQKIPPLETTKKLTDNTISPKDAPTTLDESVTQKAQKVLGIEEKTEDIESNLDFFDDFMKAEATPAETISETPVDQPTENIEEGLDFFDDFMKADAPNSDNVTEPKDDQPTEQIEDGLDFFDDFMKEEAATPDDLSTSTKENKNTVTPDDIIESKNELEIEPQSLPKPIRLNANEFKEFFNEKLSDLDDISTNFITKIDSLEQINEARFLFIHSTNTLITNLEDNDQTKLEISQFLKGLELHPDRLASLKIIHLDQDQWQEIKGKLSFLVQQNQKNQNPSAKMDKKETDSESEFKEAHERLTSRNANMKSEVNQSKSKNVNSHLIHELEEQIIEEEALKQERTKLREKRAAEKEHDILEKELETWERKHGEIKRDAELKRRTP